MKTFINVILESLTVRSKLNKIYDSFERQQGYLCRLSLEPPL